MKFIMRHLWALLAIGFCVAHAQSPLMNVCDQLAKGLPIKQFLQNSTLPKMAANAGEYYIGTSGDNDPTKCVKACCEDTGCHVSFLFAGKTCYRLHCKSRASCVAQPSAETKQKNSIFVYVRDPMNRLPTPEATEATAVAPTQADTSTKVLMLEAKSDLPFGAECALEADVCAQPFVCADDTKTGKKLCACTTGTSYQKETNNCTKDNPQLPVASEGTKGATVAPKDTTTDAKPTDESKTKTTLKPKPIEISVVGPIEVQLPIEDSVKLTAKLGSNEELNSPVYAWLLTDSKVDEVEGTAAVSVDPAQQDANSDSAVVSEGWDKQTLQLTKLKPGTYSFEVKVTEGERKGSAQCKLSVLPERKPNQPPVAKVSLDKVTYVEGAKILLDGSGSTDPDGDELTYKWAQIAGPAVSMPASNAATLQFESLPHGQYKFGLTVSDSNGGSSSAAVEVLVEAARDDPPEARAGRCGEPEPGDFSLRLPVDRVYICGNSSKDDYGIVSWSWSRVGSSEPPVDTTGTGTPTLTVSNVNKAGSYQFALTVKDAKEQQDQTTLQMIVLEEENQPPKAEAGVNQTVILPETTAVLDGTQSSDDGTITTYKWTMIQGNNEVQLLHADNAKATVTGLAEGVYQFKLNVTDEKGLSSTDTLFVTVKRSKNLPPVAVVDSVVVTLPTSLAVLNASKSTDDAGIVKWAWIPSDNCPGDIRLLGNSASSSALLIGGLHSPFVCNFTVNVTDQGALSDAKSVKLTVQTGAAQNESVELYVNLRSLTRLTLSRLDSRLAIIVGGADELDSPPGRVDTVFTDVTPDYATGRSRLVFYMQYADTATSSTLKLLRGVTAVRLIQRHLDSMAEFKIHSVDTLYCSNNCSSHGVCDDFTKACQCESYWMPNLFAQYFGGRQNCEWSVLYFVLLSVLCSFAVASLLWFLVGGRSRRQHGCCSSVDGDGYSFDLRTPNGKRRRRYRLLQEDSPSSGSTTNPNGGLRSKEMRVKKVAQNGRVVGNGGGLGAAAAGASLRSVNKNASSLLVSSDDESSGASDDSELLYEKPRSNNNRNPSPAVLPTTTVPDVFDGDLMTVDTTVA